MKTSDVYYIAETNGVEIMRTRCPLSLSISIYIGGSYYVGIDTAAFGISEKQMLAHELGHCLTGSFYNRYSPFDIRERHETRADRWAIKKLVPKDELQEVLKRGCTELYEIAEHFEISEDFARKACEYYFCA